MPVIITGAVTGLAAVLLTQLGNPGNMGFCIACFLRDIAGSLKLHSAEVVQYMRPEITGLVAGAFLAALAFREYRPTGGSSPFTRFWLGFCVMIGALMFLGCPLRAVLRLGGGDWNALFGLAGFMAGVGTGAFFLNKGFSLRRTYVQNKAEGAILPVLLSVLLLLSVTVPTLFAFSTEGPGSMGAPVWAALFGGLAVGALAQRSRFCTAGGIRDVFLFRDFHLLWGLVSLFVVVLTGNLILGRFNPGFAGQPVAHTDGLWNFLGMVLAGWGSVLLGGCPLRQLILAGQGSGDSAIAVTGLVAGAAFAHNFGLASSGNGPTSNGKIAVVVCLIAVGLFTWKNMQKGSAAS